ncbi:MAG: enolase C-terminal domain-like protein [Candidatus Velthaea sp.]
MLHERSVIERVRVSAFRIPTDFPESDGTAEWHATTLVLVELAGGGARGLGYTYADAATAAYIRDILAPVVEGVDPLANGALWARLAGEVRNSGRPGIASMAISAVDNAVWDLKARIFGVPLCTLLGIVRTRVPVYGSGGFTSYPLRRLQDQTAGWVTAGIPRVKIKIGRDASADVARVRAVRAAIGPDAELFVDANGAYTIKQALDFAERFVDDRVSWFEEPVYHRDFAGMRFVRERAPAVMEVASGEYGYDPGHFAAMIAAGTIDVLQADATRCEGITGLMMADALCEAHNLPLSTHCAPAQHAHAAAAAKRLRHIEYFHDHVRIENMLFDGVLQPVDGALEPDLSRPGNGLEFKAADAQRYAL